jgi:hypothetical protein
LAFPFATLTSHFRFVLQRFPVISPGLPLLFSLFRLLGFGFVAVRLVTYTIMAEVPGPAHPQAYHHPRRVVDPPAGEEQGRLVNKPDFFWSTCISSKVLLSDVLPLVLENLVVAASRYGQSLHADDIAWLTAHNGRFKKWIHPESTDYGKISNSAKYKKHPSLIRQNVLKNLHAVVGESPRNANTSISPNYANNREGMLAQFWNFLAITKEYDSMLILLGNPFENCPSAKFSCYQSFVLHKFNPPLAPLHDSWSGGAPVLDWLGRQVLSEGSVNNHDTFPVLVAALNHLHPKFAKGGNDSGQTDPCEACYASYRIQSYPLAPVGVNQYTPCATHTDSPCRYCCRGNPYYKSCSLLQELVSYLKKESARRQYKPKSKDPLLPSDVLDIHAHVKSRKFQAWDFANYTMMLGGIYYAGRFDSYSEVKLEDFSKVSGHFSIHNNYIQNLAQQVFGKSDKSWHTYLLKFDDCCPELCYLRHLLVFVHCGGLDGAGENTHLFPDKRTVISRQGGSNDFTGDASYPEGLQWLQHMVEVCVEDSELLDLGMHSLRITFYLWGVLCGTPIRTLKKNARHLSDEMVEKYIANAEIILRKLRNNPLFLRKQRLGPPMENLLVMGRGNQTRRLDQMSGSNNNVSNLVEAAKIFVEHMLNVPSDHPRYRNASFLMELSYEKRFSGQSPDQLLHAAMDSLPMEHQAPMKAAFFAYISHFPTAESLHHQPLPWPGGPPGAAGLAAAESLPHQPLPWPGGPPGAAGLAAGPPGAAGLAAAESLPHQPLPWPGGPPGAAGLAAAALPPHQPLPWPGGPPGAAGLAAAALQPYQAVGHPPTLPRLVILKALEADPAKYRLPLKSHNFSDKTQQEQALFLYNLVQEVVNLGKTLGKKVSEPSAVMTQAERRNFVVAQDYRKGKSLIPSKHNFCRFVDPFFECLHACCNGDFAILQEQHSNKQFKYGQFKDIIQPSHECGGKLQKCW